MIAPLFDQFGRSIGIMQMFNFVNPVTKFQIDRFKAIQGFLGGCVMNIGDLTRSIATLMGVTNVLGGCSQSVKRVDSDPESNAYIFRSIYGPVDAARVICEKLSDNAEYILR
jgi:hypothetical protein